MPYRCRGAVRDKGKAQPHGERNGEEIHLECLGTPNKLVSGPRSGTGTVIYLSHQSLLDYIF